jgi:hypothetical protein
LWRWLHTILWMYLMPSNCTLNMPNGMYFTTIKCFERGSTIISEPVTTFIPGASFHPSPYQLHLLNFPPEPVSLWALTVVSPELSSWPLSSWSSLDFPGHHWGLLLLLSQYHPGSL